MRHYARAMAYVQLRNRRGFDAEVGALRTLRTDHDWKDMTDQGVPAPDLLQLAETVAGARWASRAGRLNDAIALYRKATLIEEKVPYMEPPYWYYPVQQSLGAALYRAGRYDAAASAFTTALVKSPNNGWALFGLAAAERATGQKLRAAVTTALSCRNWSCPEPGTLSSFSTVSGSSSESLPCSTRSYTVTRMGTLIRLAVEKVSSPRRSIRSPVSMLCTVYPTTP